MSFQNRKTFNHFQNANDLFVEIRDLYPTIESNATEMLTLHKEIINLSHIELFIQNFLKIDSFIHIKHLSTQTSELSERIH